MSDDYFVKGNQETRGDQTNLRTSDEPTEIVVFIEAGAADGGEKKVKENRDQGDQTNLRTSDEPKEIVVFIEAGAADGGEKKRKTDDC